MSFLHFIFFFGSVVFLDLPVVMGSEGSAHTRKSQFDCAHQCGKWGSRSIQSLEWEFVQCLYQAHELAFYILENLSKRAREWHNVKFSQNFLPVEVLFHYTQPRDFSSAWYQKLLDKQPNWHLVLSDCFPKYFGCHGCKKSLWSVQHFNDEMGNHAGKHFTRIVYSDLFDSRDGQWSHRFVEKNSYGFEAVAKPLLRRGFEKQKNFSSLFF